MKNYEKQQVEQDVLKSVTCDDCKKEFDCETDVFEVQEFVSLSFMAGFGSVFGDTNQVSMDLCQHCFKERCGDVVQIEETEF